MNSPEGLKKEISRMVYLISEIFCYYISKSLWMAAFVRYFPNMLPEERHIKELWRLAGAITHS